MNLLGFISSTTPENWPKPNYTKQKKSMKSVALLWQKKKSIDSIFKVICSDDELTVSKD